MGHQLPPKVPSMNQNKADFPQQKLETNSAINHNPSWCDEFLDFSSGKRGSHRRSMSDSIAFLEAPMVEECRRSSSLFMPAGDGADGNINNVNGGGGGDFDEQIMLMLADVGPTMSYSSPSDHDSINMDDDKQCTSDRKVHDLKSEPEEVDSINAQHEDNSNHKIGDPKRIKRILANRQSAQRSRVRKLQYISELERSVTSLQGEVSVLSPRVAFLDHHRLVLNLDNSVLKQRIASLAQDKLFKDAHQEALKREIEKLRQIYFQQNLKGMENSTGTNSAAEKEQLAVN